MSMFCLPWWMSDMRAWYNEARCTCAFENEAHVSEMRKDFHW